MITQINKMTSCMIHRRSSKFVLILAKAIKVEQLKIVLSRKYFGNKISWHIPKVWRGNEKYNARPDTKVIQS